MNFNYNACLVPFAWVIAGLVLYANVMTNLKRGESSCVLVPTFSELHVPVPECLLSSGKGVSPSGVWLVPARKNWDEVFDGTAKHTLGRGEVDVGVRGVMVL